MDETFEEDVVEEIKEEIIENIVHNPPSHTLLQQQPPLPQSQHIPSFGMNEGVKNILPDTKLSADSDSDIPNIRIDIGEHLAKKGGDDKIEEPPKNITFDNDDNVSMYSSDSELNLLSIKDDESIKLDDIEFMSKPDIKLNNDILLDDIEILT